MIAIVTAGGAPAPGEPLYSETHGGPKALVDINGRPMIQWVLDALGGADQIEAIIIVGLPTETALHCLKPLTILPSKGAMLENLNSGVELMVQSNSATRHFLAASSDLPLVDSTMVDWMVQAIQAADADITYPVIERATMDQRFPGSNRTYIRLKNVEVCGGDLIGIRATIVNPQNPLFQRLVAARKSPLKQASILGLDTLVLILLRRLVLERAATLISKRLGVHGRVVRSPYAEIGMDVDKPHQLAIVRDEIVKMQA